MFVVFMFLITDCSTKDMSERYIQMAPLSLVPDLHVLEKCLEQAGVKFKIESKAIFVDNHDKAIDNCS